MQERNQRTSPWLIAWRVILTFALIGCIVFIFSNSLQIADVSEGASGRVLGILQGILRHLGLPGAADRLTMHIVRKLAHFCEYLLEGFLLMLCLRVYTRHFFKHVSWPILGGLLTALTDETIQLFVPGRSGQVTDIWIDFSGVMTGLLVGLILLGLVRMCIILYQHRNEV
jgi:VanZ family protein